MPFRPRAVLVLILLPGLLGAPAASPQPAAAPVPPGLEILEAVRLALARDPNLALQETQLQSARGLLLVAQSRFDPVIAAGTTQEDVRTPLAGNASRETRTLEQTLGLTQELRSGLSLEPDLLLRRTAVDPRAAGSAESVGEATVTFRFRQPLLRGRGRAVTTAAERAAEREVTASQLDLSQRAAERVLTVASQYWVVLASRLNLDVLAASEQSSRELLDTTRRLVEADQIPAAELVQLEANLAAKESSRLDGERSLFSARQNLGREIGLTAAEIAAQLLPATPFPEVDPAEVAPAAAFAPYLDRALARRPDVLAARIRQEAAAIRLRAAADELKPRLDLIFAPGYSGRSEDGSAGGFFRPLLREIPGASALLALSLSWPVGHRQASGQLLQSEAVFRQSELLAELLVQGIGADLPSALDAVGRAALQRQKARDAVRLFERAVANEEKKLRAGTSTLIDLISQRDRLTSARQVEIGTSLALAQAVLQLRFQTGTLVTNAATGEPTTQDVRLSALITPPQEEEPIP